MDTINLLEWDTNFFGYQIGKIVINKDFDFYKFKNSSTEFKLTYLYSSYDIINEDLFLADTKIELERNVTEIDSKYLSNRIKKFNSSVDNFEALIKLALQSGTFSRFYIDRNFKNGEYERLYKQWITNSVLSVESIEVMIFQDGSDILGFITIEYKQNGTAIIGLLAVETKSRGKGIGKALLEAAFYHVSKKNIRKLVVATQKDNVPALNLYLKNQFIIKKITKIYHYWNI